MREGKTIYACFCCRFLKSDLYNVLMVHCGTILLFPFFLTVCSTCYINIVLYIIQVWKSLKYTILDLHYTIIVAKIIHNNHITVISIDFFKIVISIISFVYSAICLCYFN